MRKYDGILVVCDLILNLAGQGKKERQFSLHESYKKNECIEYFFLKRMDRSCARDSTQSDTNEEVVTERSKRRETI